ncbi:uncharacterized protein LOC133856266 isoform X1 [Alnus glutinosa]|uniref:uncharacterized protein LOC133856266 isoform X1 n=1 Tax=Alnus glutinosa TaxID=3517 RepID=UPI002D76AE40|nr:uncharacterized protein LOC133856266 isoform X1 [Alnus glutinosa]XP_062147463.1 uncharacterized protein LOC133856266 isoform X1 [Alnus glutinosa]
MLDSDDFLNKFHHALLELHLEKGALVCPETARRFPVNQGIPNMLLHEDEDSNNGGEIQTRMTFTLIGNCGSKGFCDSVLPTTVVHAPLVCAEAGEAPAKKTEDKVETPPVSESKDKVEAGNETQEPAKEGQDEAKADKPDAAPSLEDKVDQPDAAPSSEDKSGALHATA